MRLPAPAPVDEFSPRPTSWRLLSGRWRAILPGASLFLGGAWILINHFWLHELRGETAYLPEVALELVVVVLVAAVLFVLQSSIAHYAERLSESEGRFRMLTERSPDMIYRFRYIPTFAVEYMSSGALAITGHAPAEFYADPDLVWRVMHADDAVRVRAALTEPTAADEPLLIRWLRSDGTIVWTEALAVPACDEMGRLHAVEGFARNVSVRMAAQEELIASEVRFRRITESVTDYVFAVRVADGQVTSTEHGPGCEAVTGYTPAEFAADPYLWLSMILRPDDRDAAVAQARSLLAGEPCPPLEHRIGRKDGAVRWVRSTLVPQYDAAGLLVAYDGLVSDITERHMLQEQLRQAQKMEAIGKLAGGIAHDFNNLLTVIHGYASLLGEQLPDDDDRHVEVEQIVGAAERAAALTGQLLAFSRRQVLQPRVLDPARIARDVTPMLRRLLGEHIELVAGAHSAGCVKVDPSQLEQVVINLAVNARDAMRDGGRLTIETADVDVGEDDAASGAEVAPGAYVSLTVSDTGCGMDEATQARAFEPFFTTKEPGRGTGMGLATVYGIVKQSGGFIALSSEPHVGTSIQIHLPRVDEPAALDPARSGPAPTLAGTETILFVEDDPAVRSLASGALAAQGYAVLEASNGAEALALTAGQDAPIDLVVTDLVMPAMGGRELAERLWASRPGLRVLYVSGFPQDQLAGSELAEPGLAFLPKPFTAHALAKAVREVLDAAA